MNLRIGGQHLHGSTAVMMNCPHDVLIGRDVLRKLGPVTVDLERNVMYIGGTKVPIGADIAEPVVAMANMTIPPRSKAVVTCQVVDGDDADRVFTPDSRLQRNHGVAMVDAMVLPLNGLIQVQVANTGRAPAKIYAGTHVGSVERVLECGFTAPLWTPLLGHAHEARRVLSRITELDLSKSVFTSGATGPVRNGPALGKVGPDQSGPVFVLKKTTIVAEKITKKS